jgi:glucosamine--fructose-6-phosphate aminotransferase (isomerizing)
MCGIIAVMRRASSRQPPASGDLRVGMQQGEAALAQAAAAERSISAHIERAYEDLVAVDRLLRGVPGVRCLLGDPELMDDLDAGAGRLADVVGQLELSVDVGSRQLFEDDVEDVNARLLKLKDAVWAIRMDRVAHARAVSALAGRDASAAAVEGFSSVELALSALNRLEVRGRDSAGLHLIVRDHGLALRDPVLSEELKRRSDPIFRNRAVFTRSGHLCFVYKVAREVGELGDNTRHLRDAIGNDDLLRRALESESAKLSVLGHTRWASVGLINEANAHPVNQEAASGSQRPYVVAALNGDVDNHRALVEQYGLEIAPEITTDAKVIPSVAGRELADGRSCQEAFRRTVDQLHGSVAVAATTALEPSKLMLAVRGSGQTLCIGVEEDVYIVASEPYGVVEVTSSYVRMDGEAISEVDGSKGQIVVVDADSAGRADRIRRLTYGGAELPVGAEDILSTEITTRDIDRGSHRHFFLKEISESPDTMRKTLRGRIREVDGRKRVRLGPDTVPDALRTRLRSGAIRRIVVVGQGTAAIAGKGVAASIASAIGSSPLEVRAEPASELSAFGLRDDMSDTLVVAVSQSGTTTDTNRTVDLARGRGAAVIAIVNRRNSDITHKADGVLYTSDGRDIEMSVASTKAFYSQIAAGFLLGFALGDALGCAESPGRDALLAALSSLPETMDEVLARQPKIRALAKALAPRKRQWAVVGNGRNLIAAHEIRIKLSELCYKSIALDVTEDKKHVDLSSEPLTLICATGLTGSAAADVAKEVAILRAHKGAPVVVATDGTDAFADDENLIAVPPVHADLAYVLSTMAGHLFGYEAALAIDAQAHPLREARASIDAANQLAADNDAILADLTTALAPHIGSFRRKLWSGLYDSSAAPQTTARLASLFGYVEGATPLDLYDREFGRPGTPGNLVEDLISALTFAIDDLTRSIDTIRHQAKTVTVGISRSDEELFTAPLVSAVLNAGCERERLSHVNLRTLAALNPAVLAVTGYSRYEIQGDPARVEAAIRLIEQGGSVKGTRSRTDSDHALRGTKKIVAEERDVLVARGRSDGRLVVFIPEVASGVTTNMVLLHVVLHDRLEAGRMRRVLDGYRRRLSSLASAVIESDSIFDEQQLGDISVEALLTTPIGVLADMWDVGGREPLTVSR